MKLIALEGIDSSGKETQAKMLAEKLVKQGYKVVTESFPRSKNPIGKLIKDWLEDKIILTDETVHMLFEADRVNFKYDIQELEKLGFDFLILDRYTLSNLAFGMAKGLDLNWLRSLQITVRQPDLTFILDITFETSLERKPSNRDKYEKNKSLINRARIAYFTLSKLLKNEDTLIKIIDANRSPEEINEEIMSFLNLVYIDN